VCRTDLHLAEGDLPPRRPAVTPGHEVVGIVDAVGEGASRFAVGERIGVAWLGWTDGSCRCCRRGDENLCTSPLFTGWDVDGGFAEYTVAPAAFVYRLPVGMTAMAAAPLLCAGIIGYRCLRLVGIVGDDAGLPGGLGSRRLGRRQARAATRRSASPSTASAATSLCTQVAIWRG
jgi:propanol-preferring alcohol dehydrogenase